MFGKKKPQVAPDEDDAEARAKARRKKATRLPKGVKQLIGYDAMLRNGIASLATTGGAPPSSSRTSTTN
mgnify:CR=1 FL=1